MYQYDENVITPPTENGLSLPTVSLPHLPVSKNCLAAGPENLRPHPTDSIPTWQSLFAVRSLVAVG